ncbi:MAG: MFS transporter [Bacilli bacterium]|nr:MFS transporter [Bacilli bacterium]
MENTEKLEKRRLREERQYNRLQKENGKKRYLGYLFVLIGVILLVDLLDNFVTNVNSNVTSCYITEFFIDGHLFGKDYTFEQGLSLNNTFNLAGYAIGLLVPFYKALGDKYGRKPLFIVSTLGMALGLVIVFLSKSYWGFLAGSFIISFFISHDIQIIYILEEAPAAKRATIYSLLKGIGALGTFFIPLLRLTAMNNDPTLWRNIYLIPGIAGIVISLLVFILTKESKVFVHDRLEYLSIPFEQRISMEEKAKKEKKANANKSGIFNAIKYIFQHKDLRNLIIIKTVFDAAIIAMTQYEPIMSQANMTTENITDALFLYPIIYCVAVIISGFLADKIGRKKIIVIFGSICLLSFVGFIVSVLHNESINPYVIGIFYGLYIGGYWIGRDYMEIISTEMVPTDIRASIIGAEGLLVYVGMAVGFGFVTVGQLLIPIWLTCLIFSVPCIAVSVILLTIKVKETKGIDYESIKE